MGLFSAIGRQLQHPRGLFGKALFRWMTPKTIGPARWTADLLDVQPGDAVLEIGFGNGANLELLAQCAVQGLVAGAEISETAIEVASKRNARAVSEGRVQLHRAAGGALPFDDGTFDKACTVATVYVIADPSAVFREMHRVLKPNGLAAVTFPVRDKFMRFKPTRTERNDTVRFGAHCMLGRKPAGN